MNVGLSFQGQIRTMKELDYEISHGRYTLLITATDQCPIPSRRLTSTTMVCFSSEKEMKFVGMANKGIPLKTTS